MHAQGSDEWFLDRAGSATASRFKDVVATTKARADYLAECVTERLTKEPINRSHGKAGDWGTKMEPVARMAYEQHTGLIVRESGFIHHPNIEYCGASPDGLIDEDGGLEVKCPINTSIHLSTVLAKQMPSEHIPQVQGSMMVAERDWWDFVSFNPNFPEPLRLFVQRIRRDDVYINRLEEEIMLFNGEVQNTLDKIIREYKL